MLYIKNRIDTSNSELNKKVFDSEVIDTLYNLTSTEERSLFFNKFNSSLPLVRTGGIYLIQYKDDLNIYYIYLQSIILSFKGS